MPIDASIPLQVRPMQVESPVDQYSRALTLRSLMNKTSLEQANLEAVGLENQERQRSMNAQQTLSDLLAKNSTTDAQGNINVDHAAVMTGLAQGGYGKEAMAYDTQRRADQKAQLDNHALQLGNLKKQNDMVAQAAGAVLNAPPEQQQAIYTQARQSMIQQGVVKPEQIPEQLDPTWLQQHYAAAIDADKQLTAHQKDIEFHQKVLTEAPDTAKKWSELLLNQGSGTKNQQDLDQLRANMKAAHAPDEVVAQLPVVWTQQAADAMANQAMTAEQRATVAGQAAGRTETARHNVAEEATSRGRLRVEQQAQNLRVRQFSATLGAGRDANGQPLKGPDGQALTGEAFLAALPPDVAAKVRAIAEGRQTQLPRGKELDPIMNMVNQYDPTYSTQRAEMRKAFTTGRQGDNIGALNTAAVHLDQLGEAARAMSNGSFRPGNALFNRMRTMFGGSMPTNFKGIKTAVAGEMATALKGNATDPEIAAISESIDSASSPKQLADIVDAHLHVLGAKLNTYNERYQEQLPNDKVWSPVKPSARAVFEKHGFDPTAGAASTSAASAPPFPHTLSAADVGKVYTNKEGKRLKITAVNPTNPKQFKFDEVN